MEFHEITVSEKQRFEELETTIEKGINTFYEVGSALLEIRDSRLYRQEYKTFEEYCQNRWNIERRHAYRLIEATQVIENVSQWDTNILPVNERQIRPLTQLEPEQQKVAWNIAQETNNKITAEHVKDVVKTLKETLADNNGEITENVITQTVEKLKEKNNNLAPLMTSNSEDWYTPQSVIDCVLELFGVINLDPCSNGSHIPAEKHYTIADNGLNHNWYGKIYVNPPYGETIGLWIDKVIEEYSNGNIEQAVLLLPARTDTKWFRKLNKHLLCFVNGRLKFSGHNNSAPFPNVIVGVGCNENDFINVFGKMGDVYKRVIPNG